MSDRTVVLVHGAWHGAWCWEKVTPHLDAAGVAWRAVDLPMTSLPEDVAAVTAVLDEVRGPVLLVGHSYGGVVITGAGMHPSVERLLYIAAFAVAEDESAAATLPDAGVAASPLGAAFIFEDGAATLERAGAMACLYNRCPDADAAAAFDRLRPIAMACLVAAVGVAAWRTVPTTYLVCTDDAGVPPELQRLMAHRTGGSVIEWDVDHSPFYADPGRTGSLLVSLAHESP